MRIHPQTAEQQTAAGNPGLTGKFGGHDDEIPMNCKRKDREVCLEGKVPHCVHFEPCGIGRVISNGQSNKNCIDTLHFTWVDR